MKNRELTEMLKEFDEILSSDRNRYERFISDPSVQKKLNTAFKVSDPNKLTVKYLFAKTQSGKTDGKFSIAEYAIKNDLADVAVIVTANLVDAEEQMTKSLVDFVVKKNNGIDVGNIRTMSHSLIKENKIIIGILNSAQLIGLQEEIQKICDMKRMHKVKNKLRFIFIQDEGELRDAAAGDDPDAAVADQILNQIIFNLPLENPNEMEVVGYFKVSATLASAFLSDATSHTDTYGFPDPNNVFVLPLTSSYVGIETKSINHWNKELEFYSILHDEERKMFAGRLNDLQKSKNISIICDALWQQCVDQSRNKFNVTNVANVVFPLKKDGHDNFAFLANIEFKNRNLNTFICDKNNDVSNIPANTDVAIVVYNGTTNKEGKLAQKLTTIGNKTNGKIKLVIIIGKKMGDRSIRFDCDNYEEMKNPSSYLFGMYCNISVIVSNEVENIESLVQYLRCSGIRPPIKNHTVITTPRIADEIRDYYILIDEILADLNKNGRWKDSDLKSFQDRFGTRRMGSSKVNNTLFRVRQGKAVEISEETRNEFLQQKIYSVADIKVEISKEKYEELNMKPPLKIQEECLQIVKNEGFNPDSNTDVNIRKRIHERPRRDIRQTAQQSDGSAVTIRTLETEENGGIKYWLYAKNHSFVGKERIEYRINKDDQDIVHWNPTYIPSLDKSDRIIVPPKSEN